MKQAIRQMATIMVAGAATLAGLGAHASQTGDKVHGLYLYPDTSTVFNDLGIGTVGVNYAFGNVNNASTFSIALYPDQIHFDFGATGASYAAAFDGISFEDLTQGYTSAMLDPTSDVSGVTAADVSLTGGKIYINLANASFTAGEQITIDETTGPSISAPEPATWAMLLVGFGLAGATVRRRRSVGVVATA